MAFSLALIILLGLLSDYLFRRLGLPGLIGMLITGILAGPHVFNILSPSLLEFSSDFRSIALIVIMLRAGMAIRKDTLNRVGITALMMGSVPALIEGLAIAAAARILLGFTLFEAAVLGCVIAAVSPAVVVPSMLRFIDEKRGAKKGIPTLLLASATLDNVFVLVVFSAVIQIQEKKTGSLLLKLTDIPVSVVTGIVLGILAGFFIMKVFSRYHPRVTKKSLILIGSAILLVWLEQRVKPYFALSSVACVITAGFMILERSETDAHMISKKLGKIWIFAEILLFVLIGAQVDLPVVWSAGLYGAAIIFTGVAGRGIGTWLSLFFMDYDQKEKVFCIVSFVPKATVQAAIGAIPLSMGMSSGEIILAVSVLSILITAPLGAVAIDSIGERVLDDKTPE